MAEVNLDLSGLAAIALLAKATVHEVAEDIADDMRRFVPVDTGALRAGISVEHGANGDPVIWSRRVGSESGVPVFVEFGTRPHVIEPDTAEALAWPGGDHPVTRVNHPGTRAQPYMRPALYRRGV